MPFCAENTLMIIAVSGSAVLVWLFCAFSAASIARDNGYNYNLWLLIGFLGGPIALAGTYLYFVRAGERHRLARHSDGGRYGLPEMIHCPQCKQSVPSSYDDCQFCGAPLHRKRKH
jgi:hypothetical protein